MSDKLTVENLDNALEQIRAEGGDINYPPDKPCPGCKQDAWYWPGDYYVGPKQWLCQRCHPVPKAATPVRE